MTQYLEGLRVVEVALLGPNGLGMHLADLGADVVKVEEPGRGDYTRSIGTLHPSGISYLHLHWNRGKRSVAVDLTTPAGADVFRDLVRGAEVVIEGLRPGALERRGLGPDALREVNPSLVFVSLSGFGQTGPYRDLGTHGVAYDAYAGNAPPETTADGFPAIPERYIEIGLSAGALHAAMTVLAAVLRARTTGEGAVLDVAQADAAVGWRGIWLDRALTEGAGHGWPSLGLQDSVRYQYYETADGRYVLFQASEAHFFANFCRAVGRPELADAHPGAPVGEHARGDVELRGQLAEIFRTRTQREWVALFIEHDVPGAPVHDMASLLEDEQFGARAVIVEQDHPVAGRVRMLAPPAADESFTVARPAPALGQHTVEVLRELGYDEARVAALVASGAVATP